MPAFSGFNLLMGEGDTPELAYQEVLKVTAKMVHKYKYIVTRFGSAPGRS